MNCIFRVSIIAGLVFSTSISHAQTDSSTLENITVTSSLLAQQKRETGRNIFLVKPDSLKSLPVNSVDELLRYLPGVEVQLRGPQGSQSDIVIRGGTFQQVLVIIDGIKLNDPLTGHFNSYIPINAGEIERIEVLKGAASAVYGSEAVGGVINIITKTFAAKNKTPKNTISGKVTAGEYNLLNNEVYGRWSDKATIISAGIMTNNAKGPQLRGTTGFFHNTTANIALTHLFRNNWAASFRSAGDFRDFNAQNFYTTFLSDTANEKVNSWWNHFNISKKTKKGVLNMDAGYKKLRDQYWFRPTSTPNDNKTNMATVQLYYTSSLAEQHNYTIGAQVLRKEIKSNDRGNHSLWHGAAYAIFRHELSNNVFLNESLRLDCDENYGAILVPQINFAWSPSIFTVRASAGRSFRDADFTERYNNFNKALVTGGSIGNPGLAAENSWNIETGFDAWFSKEFHISSTIFHRNHTNLIDWTPTPYAGMPRQINLVPSGNYALAKNVAEIRTTGIEVDFVLNKKLNHYSSVYATLGYTWLQSENNDPLPSFYISSHAKHVLNFSAVYNYKNFSLATSGIYKERNSQKANAINAEISKSYFVVNIKLNYQSDSRKGKLFVQADNLLNTSYSDLLGSKMLGRWISGGFEITL
ncbi:MAG: TonB-dependent receptor [Chitinophagaceae bacterium]|nr:TonB-dependent receptor [Chitinophagaceae bacterium]